MNEIHPLVSVIMTVYNEVDVVGAAIESVLGQTLQDFELLVVDDASTDGSLEVIESYAARDFRIRTIRNPTRSRGGPVEWDARNDGLKLARGRFLAYPDGDNTLKPGFLKTLSEVLLRDPKIQLAHCDSCNHYPPGVAEQVIAADLRDLAESGPDWTVFSYEFLDPRRLGAGIYIDANEILHRTSVFRTLGTLWRTFHPRRTEINALQVPRRTYRRHADLDLVERIVEAFGAESVYHVPQPLVDFYYTGAKRDGLKPE